MKLLILVMALLLSACDASSGPPVVSYAYAPPQNPGGRMCTNECASAKDYCSQGCSMKHRQCVLEVQTQAMRDYEHYTQEQFAHHQSVELHASDFERTVACDGVKTDCAKECEKHYRSCYSDCGGTIKETTSCTSFCF